MNIGNNSFTKAIAARDMQLFGCFALAIGFAIGGYTGITNQFVGDVPGEVEDWLHDIYAVKLYFLFLLVGYFAWYFAKFKPELPISSWLEEPSQKMYRAGLVLGAMMIGGTVGLSLCVLVARLFDPFLAPTLSSLFDLLVAVFLLTASIALSVGYVAVRDRSGMAAVRSAMHYFLLSVIGVLFIYCCRGGFKTFEQYQTICASALPLVMSVPFDKMRDKSVSSDAPARSVGKRIRGGKRLKWR